MICTVCTARTNKRCIMCPTFYCSKACQRVDREAHDPVCARIYKGCAGCRGIIKTREFPCLTCKLNYFCSATCMALNTPRHLEVCVPTPGVTRSRDGRVLHEVVARDNELLKDRLLMRLVSGSPRGLELFTGGEWVFRPVDDLPDVTDKDLLVKRINSMDANEFACGVLDPFEKMRVCTVVCDGIKIHVD